MDKSFRIRNSVTSTFDRESSVRENRFAGRVHGSDGSTTERPGGGRAACWPTELNGGLDHRIS